MESTTVAKTFGIYSIVFGSLNLFDCLVNFQFFAFLISILFLAFGIVIVVKTNGYADEEKPFVITLFVFYCLFAFIYIILILISANVISAPANLVLPNIPNMSALTFSILQEVIVAVPIVFGIIYFVSLANPYGFKRYNKKNRYRSSTQTDIGFQNSNEE